ncbi:MAG: AraC family transcriptional regulator [Gallionella sp.]|nr:AraC family transcriptional regulator [Gallionella sp.]
MHTPLPEKNIISFVAHHAQVEVHRHHCFQILLGLSAPFSSNINGTLHAGRRALLINQNVAHACNASEGSSLIFFIDAESRTGWQLRQMLDGLPILDLTELWLEAVPQSPTIEEIQAWSHERRLAAAEDALTLLAEDVQLANVRDSRIDVAIAWVEQHVHEKIGLPDVAAQIQLSPERTRHLFMQEAGVSFSQFLMWKRIKLAIVYVVRDGVSLTEAASRAGFSDQAHFCRLFKRTFGIPAGGLLQNSRFIQFIHPSVS